MKAVLVIDMPEGCNECPCAIDICFGTLPPNDYYKKKPSWCPLRPLPQEGTEYDVIDTKTGKYADLQKIALKEEWAKGLVYCDMEGFAIEQDGTLVLLDECGNCAYPPEGRFKIVWNIGETE